jgi:hypothetical protein
MSARMCGPVRLVASSETVGPSFDRDWVEM